MLRKPYRVLTGLFVVLVSLVISAGYEPPTVVDLPTGVLASVAAPPALATAPEPVNLASAPIVAATPSPPAPVAEAAPALPEPAPERKMWPGPNEVWIWGGEYRPGQIVVPVGTTVTWTGIDAEEHDVESDDRLFFGNIVQGVSFSYTFAEPGSYYYHCNCGCIEGVVIVE